MPNIIVEAGPVNKENKNRLIRRLTETASEITGIPVTSYTVLIKEFPVENWGVGGEPLDELLARMQHA
jgi:4-oxalocrotonate tautomerase